MTEGTRVLAPLLGLVLAGGDSRRMGRDKGQLEYRAVPQVRRALDQLRPFCEAAYVSVRADQRGAGPYASLPQIVDEPGVRGPVAGLLAGWASHPDAAWLIVAADMPFVTAELLATLVRSRGALATAYRQPDGTVEPLCSIWEPAARGPLLARVGAGDASLRRFLAHPEATLLEPPDPGALRSVDTWTEYLEASAELAANGPGRAP